MPPTANRVRSRPSRAAGLVVVLAGTLAWAAGGDIEPGAAPGAKAPPRPAPRPAAAPKAAPAAPHPSAAPAPPPGEPVRVMPLGDSITQADKNHRSYRYWLYRRLGEAGYGVDFVGSQNQHGDGPPPRPPAGAPTDPDHEGHWGWTTAQVRAELDGWLRAARPQIVLVHLGTNNLVPPEAAAADLERLIDACRGAGAATTVILARLIPAAGAEKEVAALNEQIDALAARKQSLAAPVLVVDLNRGFDVQALTSDGIHPNEAGERWIADRFYAALSVVLDRELFIAASPLPGRLGRLQRFVRGGDYAGITQEVDDLMAGGALTGWELDAAAALLDALAGYSNAQRDRVRRLVQQKRHYDAGPILTRLAQQFRGTPVGYEARDELAAWQRDSRLARELAAGPAMQLARDAEKALRHDPARTLYLNVVRQHAGTAAAAEAQRCADDLAARGLAK